ncbi:MAG: aminotransferase class I/II [Bacteroidetes bacterium]|nr:MAG: aminotransferase class I/II [Bacteroidota bacterium]
MSTSIHRREWLRQSSLAALGLGLSLKSLGNEERLPRSFGSDKGLINLGSNENPYGISPKARQAILDMMGETNRYQFNIPSLREFAKTLAPYYGITEGNISLVPGSGEALGLLSRHFSDGSLVTATPTFFILPNTSKSLGVKVVEVPLTEGKVHDLPKMLSAITNDTKMVYICNPANPTATILKSGDLKDFCNEASKKATVVIDEAYIDFLNPPDNVSMISLIATNPNIIVLRTFSKIHAMAGLRIGFVAAHPDTIKKLEDNYFRDTQICISNLTMAGALASIKDEEHRASCKQKNEAARNFTFQELQKLNYHVIPSYTNFIFFNLGNYPGDFSQDMLKKNIILRSNTYPDGKWGRVSIGTLTEMQQFIKILKDTKK